MTNTKHPADAAFGDIAGTIVNVADIGNPNSLLQAAFRLGWDARDKFDEQFRRDAAAFTEWTDECINNMRSVSHMSAWHAALAHERG